MANNERRVAGGIVVAVVIALVSTHGCIYGSGKRGTNIGTGGWGSGDDLPPPGQPPFRSTAALDPELAP